MNPDTPSWEPDWDDELAGVLAADPLPPTPADLVSRVRRRLRRRRHLQRAAWGLSVMALLSFGVLAWQSGPRAEPLTYEFPEPAFLRAAPPVDTLDLLARQQTAYLAALEEMKKEF